MPQVPQDPLLSSLKAQDLKSFLFQILTEVNYYKVLMLAQIPISKRSFLLKEVLQARLKDQLLSHSCLPPQVEIELLPPALKLN